MGLWLNISPLRRQRGAILAVSFFLVVLASISTLLMARTLLEQQQINSRRRELSRAFYMAEAGVSQVVHWIAYPADFSNPSIFELSDDETTLEIFSGGASSYMIPANDLPQFMTADNATFGRVKSIELLPPRASDPVPNLFKIRSVGQSGKISRIGAVEDGSYGAERTVVYFAERDPIADLTVPAGLISYNVASLGGSFSIRWGEAWSQSNFAIDQGPNSVEWLDSDDADYDPYAVYRTESTFDFANNWSVYNGGQFGNDDLYDLSADQPGLFPDDSGNFADAFIQNIPEDTLVWPDLASMYQDFKELALANGRYYSTDASGNIYRGEAQSNFTLIADFDDEFDVFDPDNPDADFAFIDTIDGNPPAADGSNLTTILSAGSSNGMRGFFYINANIRKGGAGNPRSVDMVSPDGETLTENVWLDGVLYTAGSLEFSGNPTIYGSIITEVGFMGIGTPTIYYNVELANGIPFPLVSPIRLTLWRNF